MTKRPRIAVFGSVHMDLIAHCDDLPEKATSGLAHGFTMGLGGKAGHQAIACAALGAEVSLISQVGDDAFGHQLLAKLKMGHVDCSGVMASKAQQTGSSTVLSSPEGYTSLIYPGAAQGLSAEQVAQKVQSLMPLDMLLVQLELPIALSLAAAKTAKAGDARVVLNLSPAPTTKSAELQTLLQNVSILVVNDMEAKALGAKDAAALAHMIGGLAVVTRGAQGCEASLDGEIWHQNAVPVAVKNTVGAGDAFLAGLCLSLVEDDNVPRALENAAQAAARKLSDAM